MDKKFIISYFKNHILIRPHIEKRWQENITKMNSDLIIEKWAIFIVFLFFNAFQMFFYKRLWAAKPKVIATFGLLAASFQPQPDTGHRAWQMFPSK